MAPLRNQMLSDIKFLGRREVYLDLGDALMILDGDTVPMITGRAEGPIEAHILTVRYYPCDWKKEAGSVHSSTAAWNYVTAEYLQRDYGLNVGSHIHYGEFVYNMNTARIKGNTLNHLFFASILFRV